MCEVMEDPHKSRMLNSQTMQVANGPNCKANKAQQTKVDTVEVNDTNSNMPNYFRSSTDRAANKSRSGANEHNNNGFSKVFFQESGLRTH